MPKKETWLKDEQLDYIRKQLGILPDVDGKYHDKGVSEWIREAVQRRISEEEVKRIKEGK